ncbi:C-terminal helicase domain-containing protein, partial [Aspergillus stella-maris]|uniref:C-terminal helicase domain-containing protein n=1 Tax=Aspergillus stella-maris TaxID=1810926 RepID=UPI003CCCE929
AYQKAALQWREGATKPPTYLLSPRRLAALARDGHIDAITGFHVLPVILGLICLARTYTDKQPGTDIPIGREIPPKRCMTVELCFSPRVQQDHDQVYGPLARILKFPSDDEDEAAQVVPDDEGRMHMGIFRWLALVGFSPRLYMFAKRVGLQKSLAQPMREATHQRPDLGFSLFFSKTCLEPNVTVPNTAVGQALYLAGDCPKLRYLLKIFDDEGLWEEPFSGVGPVLPKPRFLIFTRWPLTAWMVEMFLDALGVRYALIRSGQTSEERSAAKAYFCNPKSDCQVALASYATGSLGLNLHSACARTVMLESSPNISTDDQVVGRTHRMGQKLAQKIWMLFGEHTIDRYIAYNNTRKFLPQAAATLEDGAVRHLVEEKIKRSRETTVPQAGGEDQTGAVPDGDEEELAQTLMAEAIEQMAVSSIMRQFGQASSRLLMDD